MRAVVQRVSRAAVSINGAVKSSTGRSLLVLLGIEENDVDEDSTWLAGKIARMRLFPDAQGIMNMSAMETGAEAMVVSQFTLHASTKKGNRPSYIRAARPEKATLLYGKFITSLARELGRPVATGEFGAMMELELVNDGPVTILIDSKNRE
jgi:D-tyrosyl-tRNA(Tyr) deacylase